MSLSLEERIQYIEQNYVGIGTNMEMLRSLESL